MEISDPVIHRPIRNLGNKASRFCDVIIDAGKIYLEKKDAKKVERIPWDDVVYQVESAKTELNNSHD